MRSSGDNIKIYVPQSRVTLQAESAPGQSGQAPVPSGVLPGYSEYVDKWVVVGLDHKVCTVLIVLYLIYHCPIKARNFNL